MELNDSVKFTNKLGELSTNPDKGLIQRLVESLLKTNYVRSSIDQYAKSYSCEDRYTDLYTLEAAKSCDLDVVYCAEIIKTLIAKPEIPRFIIELSCILKEEVLTEVDYRVLDLLPLMSLDIGECAKLILRSNGVIFKDTSLNKNALFNLAGTRYNFMKFPVFNSAYGLSKEKSGIEIENINECFEPSKDLKLMDIHYILANSKSLISVIISIGRAVKLIYGRETYNRVKRVSKYLEEYKSPSAYPGAVGKIKAEIDLFFTELMLNSFSSTDVVSRWEATVEKSTIILDDDLKLRNPALAAYIEETREEREYNYCEEPVIPTSSKKSMISFEDLED